jgi:hypothetical protein
VPGPADATLVEFQLRYAILFSGMTERRSLNGLEFCYRALIDHFGLDRRNIHVLTCDGSLRTCDEPNCEAVSQGLWPGDGTPFRLKVSGEGSRDAFRRVLQNLRRTLTAEDCLFISVSGHGGNYGDGRGPFLVAYPRRMRYWM